MVMVSPIFLVKISIFTLLGKNDWSRYYI
jgi:hypothetical protein